MDLPSRSKWFEYSRARDMMLKATDTKHAPWHILRSDDKKRARLNCIAHILNLIPYKKVPREKVKLPKRSMKGAYDDEASLEGPEVRAARNTEVSDAATRSPATRSRWLPALGWLRTLRQGLAAR